MITPRRDRRAAVYTALCLTFAVLGLLRGEPQDVALGIPFGVVALLGQRSRRPIVVSGTITFDEPTCLEGDEVHGTIQIVRPAGPVTTMTVDNRRGWTAIDPHPALVWSIPGEGDAVAARFTVRADTWGRHRLGAVNLTFRHRYGLVVWEMTSDASPSFEVLPTPHGLRQLLPPPASQTASGMHLSRLVGDGLDFAELRPFSHGDRLRDINWRASARSEQLQTNRRHPDRSGEVVILLDTFGDAVGTSSTALQAALTRAARAAWAIAQLHLGVQDRVGLAAQGRIVTQLRPRSGDRARYELLRTLLTVGGMMTAGESAVRNEQLDRLPPGALILALTPLIDTRFVMDVVGLQRAGRAVMVVAVELTDLLPPPADAAEVLSRRLFQLSLDQHHDQLVDAGLPVATWRSDSDLSGIIGSLNRLHRGAAVRR